MREIIPAILPKDFEDLREKIELVQGISPLIHLDVTDGTFTPHANWPYLPDHREGREEDSISFFDEINFDVHLMVKDPLAIAEDWIRAGVHGLIIHAESFNDSDELVLALKVLKNRFEESISYIAPEIGLAIKLDTSIESIKQHITSADYIHLMSINEIGQQGQEFDEAVFDKISELQTEFPDIIISVDGGVSLENVDELLSAGVDKLIIGSAIFASDEPTETLDTFLDITDTFNE